MDALTRGGPSPIRLDDIARTTRVTFRAVDSIRDRQPRQVAP